MCRVFLCRRSISGKERGQDLRRKGDLAVSNCVQLHGVMFIYRMSRECSDQVL